MNVLLKFYHRLGSPREFYKISSALIPWLGWTSLILILLASYLGLVVAPSDYQQGDSYRMGCPANLGITADVSLYWYYRFI